MPTYTTPGTVILSNPATNRETSISVLLPAMPVSARGLQLQISKADSQGAPTVWNEYPQLFTGGSVFVATGLLRDTVYWFRVAAVYGLIDCTSQIVPGAAASRRTEGDQPVATLNLSGKGTGTTQNTLLYEVTYISPVGSTPTLYLQRSPDDPATEIWTTISTIPVVNSSASGSFIDTGRVINTQYKYRLMISVPSGSFIGNIVLVKTWDLVPLPGGEVTFDDLGATYHTIEAPATLPAADSTHGAATYYVLGWKLKTDLDTAPWNYIETEPGVVKKFAVGERYEVTGRTANTGYRYVFFTGNSNVAYVIGPVAGIVTELSDPAFTLSIPATPPAPILLPVSLPIKNPSNTKISIKAPVWGGTRLNVTTQLKLWRRNVISGQLSLMTVWNAPGGVYEDIGTHTGKSYEYFVKASNSAGESAAGPNLAVSNVSPTATVVWKTAAAAVVGLIELVVQATNAVSVRVEYRGGSLGTLSQRIGTPGEWFMPFDTNSIEWQGSQTFFAVATDSNGLETLCVPLVLNFNNSISTDVRWGQMDRSIAIGRYAYSVLAHGFISPYTVATPERMKRLFEFGIISPKASALPTVFTPTVLDQLEKDFANWTKISLGAAEQPSGTKQSDGTFINKNNSVSLRIASRPLQKLTKYEIVGTVRKVRAYKADEITVYTSQRIYKLSKDGWNVLKDLSTYTVPTQVDYVLVNDKVHFALATGQLYILDTTIGDKSFYEPPEGETKLLKFVEQLDNDAIHIYTSSAGTTVYRRTPTDLVPMFSLGEEVSRVHMRGAVLALATTSQKIYKATLVAAAAPATLVYSSSSAVRFIHVEADGSIFVADSQNRLYLVGTVTTQVSSNAGISLNDAALYSGSLTADTVATAGESVSLLLQAPLPSLALTPNQQFAGSTIKFLERMKYTKIAGTAGSNVVIGTADSIDESLLIVVQEGSTQYIARLQKTQESKTTYRGTGCQVYFDIVKSAKVL